jgi:hypothetical protein
VFLLPLPRFSRLPGTAAAHTRSRPSIAAAAAAHVQYAEHRYGGGGNYGGGGYYSGGNQGYYNQGYYNQGCGPGLAGGVIDGAMGAILRQ